MNLRKLLYTICLPLLLLTSLAVHAQDRTLTGRVTDAGGKGIPGVTITVKGQTRATTTTEDGSFSLSVPQNSTTLVVSSIGFISQELPISGSTFNITLQGSNAALNEVVVIGYGTSRRRDLTGSVTSVTAKDFVKGPITSPEQLIAGKVAGVQITPNSGAPGSGSRIRIRAGSTLFASNDPLIVVDGVPLENGGIAGSANALNLINPNDIESMTILKDASAAAIYGNRAANGVILITTKKGSTGALKVNFNTLNSVSVNRGNIDVLSAEEFRTLVNARGNASDRALLGTANTNWQEEIFRKAISTDNNISLSGGIKRLPYRFNIGYLNQDGILLRSNLKRTSLALNLSPKFFDNHLAVNANGRYANSKNFFANEGAIGAAFSFDPTKPVMSGKSDYGGYYQWQNNGGLNGLAPKNPLGLLNQRDDQSNVNRFIGNLALDYSLHFLPALHANLNLGIDKSHGEGTIFVPAIAASDSTRGGINNQYEQDKTNKLFEAFLSYGKDLSSIRSRIDAVAGYSYQDWETRSPSFDDRSANNRVITPAGQAFQTQNTLLSFYGRVNYSLMSKYLFTATLRRDGSSRFSEANRWGNFPSLAAAWNIKEEGFIKNSQALSALKVRFGWGITGQQEVGSNYAYQSNYFYGDSAAQYQMGNNYYVIARPQAYDESLQWEETESRNLGVDIGFANNRINFIFDYYDRDTRNLLAIVPAPAGTNFSNEILTNVGSIKNRGFEATLNTTPVRNQNFTLDLNYNITYITQNDITKLQLVTDPNYLGADVGSIGINGTIQKHTVGYRPNTFFLYKQIYDPSGKPIEGLYEDKNRDGIINELDKYMGKNPEPRVFMGFSANATLSKVSAGFSMRANYGNYMYNNVNSGNAIYQGISTGQNYLNNAPREILNSGFTQRQSWSDYWLENASFLRMDNAYLNYNVGSVAHGKANLRLSFNVQNVFVITKYTGLDPEISGGIDGSIYPRPRMFALGANLDF
jgi:iron complex outermembrane receptor protein